MNTREIDVRLQRLTAAEHRIAANLHELELHSVYQLLTTDELQGETARALNPSLRVSPTLWEMYSMLERTLSKARTLRGEGNRINAERRSEIVAVLTGPSVVFHHEDLPFSARDLTQVDARELRMTIDQLIERMRLSYEPLRDAVARADTVLRNVLPRLDSIASSIDGLRESALTLELPTHAIDRLERSVGDAHNRCITDPLSITDRQTSSLEAEVAAIRGSIATTRSSHDSLVGDLTAAGSLLDECRRLREEAMQSHEAARQKIVNPIGLRVAPSLAIIDGDNGLRDRLKPIVAMTGPWQNTRRELDGWMRIAQRLRDQLQRVARANQAPLERRAELRGRLSAFRAKMMGMGLSNDAVLAELSAEAHNELFTAPTDLGRAERLVGELGNRLTQAYR